MNFWRINSYTALGQDSRPVSLFNSYMGESFQEYS